MEPQPPHHTSILAARFQADAEFTRHNQEFVRTNESNDAHVTSASIQLHEPLADSKMLEDAIETFDDAASIALASATLHAE